MPSDEMNVLHSEEAVDTDGKPTTHFLNGAHANDIADVSAAAVTATATATTTATATGSGTGSSKPCIALRCAALCRTAATVTEA